MVNLVGNFFENLLNGIFTFVAYAVNLLLLPIDALLRYYIPNFNNLMSYVNAFFDILIQYSNWVISSFGISNAVLNIIKLELYFLLMAPLGCLTVKLAVNWFNKLKIG